MYKNSRYDSIVDLFQFVKIVSYWTIYILTKKQDAEWPPNFPVKSINQIQ